MAMHHIGRAVTLWPAKWTTRVRTQTGMSFVFIFFICLYMYIFFSFKHIGLIMSCFWRQTICFNPWTHDILQIPGVNIINRPTHNSVPGNNTFKTGTNLSWLKCKCSLPMGKTDHTMTPVHTFMFYSGFNIIVGPILWLQCRQHYSVIEK